MILTLAGFVSLTLVSGGLFYYYYVLVTYEKWRMKTNRNYPSPKMVRSEIWKTYKGSTVVTLCPALSLFLAKHNWYSKAYCGLKYGWEYEAAMFVLVFFATDFVEWGWHYMGHKFDALWKIHSPHHRYHNPSPFAVIADDAPDEIARGSPLFLFPMVLPMNIDLLFLQFILFFNLYGTMIHTGIDWPWLPIHNQTVINSPYFHHVHHAVSTKNKPMHTGFFLQIWDRAMGSLYTGKCLCSECDAAAGNRTREAYEKIVKPDYSVLLSPSFWWNWKDEDEKDM